jgi:hypothetical protein
MHFENRYGKANVKTFLQFYYKNSTRFSIEKSINAPFEQFNFEWQ